MGLFSLALPALLLSHAVRSKPSDPEKAVSAKSVTPRRSDPTEPNDDSGTDNDGSSQEYLTMDPPRGRVRRARSRATFSQPLHANTSTEDLGIAAPTLYSRIKAYIWPPREQSAEYDILVPNYRWTPIMSGIIIPFSILLEIPGLTERWYIRTEGFQTVETKPNPVILDVALAFSILCALIANVSLVLRFLEKRVQTVTLLCIVFLTIHDIINIVVVTVFGVEHRFDDGFTYGEAFWMTLCSTIASTITNVSLIVDFIRTPDFAQRGSGLTRRQRALMIIVIVLLVYIAFGALINSLLLHLTFIDGLYFTVVSIETIGFGDIVPKSTGARVWTCVYVVLGVINIGVVIAMCRETILEGLEIGYRRRMRNMRERRRDARRFRRWEARWRRAVEFRLREAGQPIWVSNEQRSHLDKGDSISGLRLLPGIRVPFFKRFGTSLKRTATMTSMDTVFGGHRNQHLNVDALTTAQLEEAALEAGVPLDMFLDMGTRRRGKDEHDDGHDGVREVGDSPIRAQENKGVVPAIAQAHAAHAFHENISSGWPSHPQTPTHAQVGRISAMLTKFAVAVAGAHAHAADAQHLRQADSADPRDARNANNTPATNDEGEGVRPEAGQERKGSMKHPNARWLKDLSRGANQRSAWTYERFMADMEAEEKKAYYVKLTIVWMLFFVFWTVGSAIFAATEGWPYGSAMYFCFLAFSTTGFGDFSPQTPAGRSVFVVWALFGVGTLTIVVSVLQEAGSSRYKSALHSQVFDKAVKKYRKKQLQKGKTRPRPLVDGPVERKNRSNDERERIEDEDGARSASGGHQHPSKESTSAPHHGSNVKSTAERHKEAQDVARKALEALPAQIVQTSRAFHSHMQFFVSGHTPADGEPDAVGDSPGEGAGDIGAGTNLNIPPDMRKLLDELAEMEGINERVKREILQDDDARKTLFMLSLERSLKHLVTSAESALSALADRDALATITALQHPGSSTPFLGDTPDDESVGRHEEEMEMREHLHARSEPALPSAPTPPSRPTRRVKYRLGTVTNQLKEQGQGDCERECLDIQEIPRDASPPPQLDSPRRDAGGEVSSSSSFAGSGLLAR